MISVAKLVFGGLLYWVVSLVFSGERKKQRAQTSNIYPTQAGMVRDEAQ